MLSCWVMFNSLRPHGLQSARLLCSWDSPGKNTGVSSHFLLQGIFKKIRDTKGTFHTKMSAIKDRNSMDLTEAADIKNRWQEYTEVYKKDLHDPDNHLGVIIHLEPDILECELK